MSTRPSQLRILPCTASFADMELVDPGVRRCEPCDKHVHDASALTRDELDELRASAGSEGLCLRAELVGDRPRLATGLAAGLLVVALSGCAAPSAAIAEPSEAWRAEESALVAGLADAEGGVISGHIRTNEGEPIADALVVLQSTQLPAQREVMTNASGIYLFAELPAGSYTVQVLAGQANVSKITQLPENARFRANFTLDPETNPRVLVGAVVERRTIPMEASSTYSSELIEVY